MNSMSGLSSHEWRGSYPVHERAERAEIALRTVRILTEASKTISHEERESILKVISDALK